MDAGWNPWHGCHKLSEGCRNCYVYRMDARYERDAARVRKNVSTFRLPVSRDRRGAYKYPAGTTFYTCFTSDFFLEDADAWRDEIWEMIRERDDCRFFIITKRVHRIAECLPDDWGEGYGHVAIAATVENQQMADARLPVYLALPIRHKSIICEPLLTPIDLSPYLTADIEQVSAGGESGDRARVCDYAWVLGIRDACVRAGVSFRYHQTGARLLKEGRCYRIPREHQHTQAKRAGIDYTPDERMQNIEGEGDV